MIYEELVKTTKSMQDLQTRINVQKNKDAQNATDIKLKQLVTEFACLIECQNYLFLNTDFAVEQSVVKDALTILTDIEESMESGLANEERVQDANSKFRNLQSSIKNDWRVQYTESTKDTVGTLEAVKSIKPEKVRECLNKITIAKNWENSIEVLQNMQMGIQEAEELISGLELDETITSFLKKANEGRATLGDLSSEVYEWIKKEKIENRIRISFSKSSF